MLCYENLQKLDLTAAKFSWSVILKKSLEFAHHQTIKVKFSEIGHILKNSRPPILHFVLLQQIKNSIWFSVKMREKFVYVLENCNSWERKKDRDFFHRNWEKIWPCHLATMDPKLKNRPHRWFILQQQQALHLHY